MIKRQGFARKAYLTASILLVLFLYMGFPDKIFSANNTKTRLAFLKDSITQTKYGNRFFTVAKVIDGDTIELDNGERVRLIGIDTPEIHFNSKLMRDAKKTGQDYNTIISLGKKAKNFTLEIADGEKVRLEFDVEARDRYKRLLAYVYLKDGRMLNAEIVKEGYGFVYTVPPNVKYSDLFIRLQREAREQNRGLWQKNKRNNP